MRPIFIDHEAAAALRSISVVAGATTRVLRQTLMESLSSRVSLSLFQILFDAFSRFLIDLETLRSVMAHLLTALARICIRICNIFDHLVGLLIISGTSALLTLLHVHLKAVQCCCKGTSD